MIAYNGRGSRNGDGREPLELWSDDSKAATSLKKELELRGYSIHVILTGGTEPIVQVGMRVVSGYANIRSMLL